MFGNFFEHLYIYGLKSKFDELVLRVIWNYLFYLQRVHQSSVAFGLSLFVICLEYEWTFLK